MPTTTTKPRARKPKTTAKRKTGNGGTNTKPGNKTAQQKLNSPFHPTPIPFDLDETNHVYQQIWALGFTHWESEYGAELLLAAKVGKALEPNEIQFLKRIQKVHNASKECEALVNELIEICME